jgi:hypothetical protein
MRERLRPAMSAEALAEMYAVPHDHRQWGDHEIRVNATVLLGLKLCGIGVSSAADLSCGNGSILAAMPANTRYYGDLAPGYDITGPIEQTVDQIPAVDLFVCCETLEHLDDPDAVLKSLRAKTSLLLLSTPVGAWGDGNPEHYWCWDAREVELMLDAAGFAVREYAEVAPSYRFGIWGCA